MLHRTPPSELVSRVALIVDQEGLDRASKILGVAKEPIARLLAGLRVHRGTVAMLRETVGAIDAREAAALAVAALGDLERDQ